MQSLIDIRKVFDRQDIFQYKIIDSSTIPFSQMVVDTCRTNACGKYGSCWTCPPGVGKLDELERKIKRYQKAVVFTAKYKLEDCFDFEGMRKGHTKTMLLLHSIVEELLAEGRDILALGCEACSLCEKCTYPEEPCRFPQKAIPSVEACGINVVDLARETGITYNNGKNTVTYFCMILFEKEGK